MSEDDCIFCKIARGDIPTEKLFEDDEMVAFNDISPQAPVHFLVIPKAHIPTLDDLTPEHAGLVGRMTVQAAKLAREKGIAEDGYRHVVNCRESGGQEVFHLHLHVLGGRPMGRMG